MWRALVLVFAALIGGAVVAQAVLAQHPPMPMATGMPAQPGQQAFGAIAEVIRLLDADPATDWNTVDLERLRQHLIDMDQVLMHAAVTQTPVPGGLVMDITGTGRTEHAIQAMVGSHARELDRMPEYVAKATPIAGGLRLTVTARSAEDAKTVARLRGLGFAGLLTEGSHHGPHHLAIARGTPLHHAR